MTVSIRLATADDVEAVASVRITSFRGAYPDFDTPYDDHDMFRWIRDELLPAGTTWLAFRDDEPVGMMTVADGWLEQLYVEPDSLREGIGSLLLDRAKELSPAGLDLWTFQVNAPARRFYEASGFVAVEFTGGDDNMERQPDVRYRWRPDHDRAVSGPV